ncbi:MAG: DUF1552 domain-containing protein [Pirellulaceae bacterium]|nr:DUF1552 domain-containing protein [Pirellulaceae bacterium]
MSRWKMNRRSWLRGSSGVLLPLPFLNLMESRAQGLSPQSPPIRFVALFKPNGVHPPSWNINGGSEYEFRMSPLMKPFERHREDILILDNMGDFGFSAHQHSSRRFLSGHHGNSKAASIDQLIADHIRGDTLHRSLELTTEGIFPSQIGCSYISFDKTGAPIPRESDPQLVFDRLFRSPLSQPKKRDEMLSLIDRVRDDSKSLERKAGVEDRRTLDQYLSVVRDTEKKLATLQSAKPGKLDLEQLKRPASGGTMNDQVVAMLDLIVLALWTDSTRCATYMLGNENSRMVFDFLGIKEQHHYLSHFFRHFCRENMESLLKIILWHMEKFDYLVDRMKSFRDQDGTLLDNSIVLFGAGMGHSDNHTATRVPTVLAGRGGGMLKTGRYIRYAKNQELSSLHLTLLRKYGIAAESYAGNSEPLPGLNGSDYEPYRERSFESWARSEGTKIFAQGRLRMSDNLDEAKIFYIDVEGQQPLRLEIEFGDFHEFNVAYYCGLPIKIEGDGSDANGSYKITKIRSLQSVFGEKALDAPG